MRCTPTWALTFHLIVNVNGYVAIFWNTGSLIEKQITLILPVTEKKERDNVKKPENYFWNTRRSSWEKYKATGISLNSADSTPIQATICEFQVLSSSRFL